MHNNFFKNLFIKQAEDVRVLLMDAMASKSQVIQIPASKSQPSAPPLFASTSSIASGGNGGPPSAISTALSDVSNAPVGSSSASFLPTASASQASAVLQQVSTSGTVSIPPVGSSNPLGARPPLRGVVSIPPEVKKQQEGMTAFSNANKNLLLLEPCNVEGLPSKRPVDQAEG